MSCTRILDLYIALGHRHDQITIPLGNNRSNPESHPAHWMLAVVPQEDSNQRCTFIHVQGGSEAYEHAIYSCRSLDSCGAQSMEKVGSIREKDMQTLLSLAKQVRPQRCQLYICELLEKMEQRSMVHPCIPIRYRAKVEPSLWTQLTAALLSELEVVELTERLWGYYLITQRCGDMERDTCYFDPEIDGFDEKTGCPDERCT